jgi:copper chaperone CopZ
VPGLPELVTNRKEQEITKVENNCHVEPLRKPVRLKDLDRAETMLLSVQGMGCPNCALRVQNGLLSLDGVLEAEVFLNIGIAEVVFLPDQVQPQAVLEAVAMAGNDGRHNYRAQIFQSNAAGQAKL